MKKMLLASVFAIASIPGYAHAEKPVVGELECAKQFLREDETAETPQDQADYEDCLRRKQAPSTRPPTRVTVAPPYQGPPPIGWVYKPYTICGDPPRCSMGVVNVQADGLNVRTVPNGYPVMALVNGTPLIPLGQEGDWLLVAAGCDLTPTFAWSWTAGVPLNRCWVYF